jgi:hypothetical protein
MREDHHGKRFSWADHRSGAIRRPGIQRWAAGTILFGGIILMVAGAFHILQALVALFNDQFYVAGEEYIYKFDLTSGRSWPTPATCDTPRSPEAVGLVSRRG